MDFGSLLNQLQDSLGQSLPSVLGAVAILAVGLLVALVVRAVIRRGLHRLRLNERIGGRTASRLDVVKIAASIVFWFIVIVTLIGVFSVLRFDDLSNPLSALVSQVMLYLPRIVLAGVLALVAWLLATVLRSVVNRLMAAGGWDEKLSGSAGVKPLSSVLGNVVYWLVLLLFLPAIVGALRIEGLMEPLTRLTEQLMAALPNIFAAVVIGVVGWLIARVLRGLVTNLLSAAGVDRFSDREHVTEGIKLSQLGGTLVFILVIVPALIAALDALAIDAISEPASNMLNTVLAAIPNLLAATVILLLAWFLGRFVAGLVAKLLENLGFDRLPARLGLGHAFAGGATDPSDVAAPRQPNGLSAFVGKVVLFFIMLFATVEAAHRLGFTGVRDLLETFIAFGSGILLGGVILVIGYWLADLAAKAIQRANPEGKTGLARIARVAILGLVLAMGLRAMGIADDIVNLAFGLVLGAMAVATALAFGLGGREAAGEVARRWAQDYLGRRDQGGPGA